MLQILYPAFAMFALTTVLVFRLGFMRRAAVATREVDLRYYRSYRGYEEPERLRVASRHVINHFEAPTLFYVVLILAYVTGQGGPLLVGLAWAYVALRAVHSYVHLTSNIVIRRFQVFALSWLILVSLWVLVGVRLALAGPA